MSPDAELVLIFGTLHLIAVALGAGLFVMFLRSETTQPWQPPDEDDGGGGGNDRLPGHPKTSPSGGLPLPDAVPVPPPAAGPPWGPRRAPGPLRALPPPRQRRPAREPLPQRRPVRR